MVHLCTRCGRQLFRITARPGPCSTCRRKRLVRGALVALALAGGLSAALTALWPQPAPAAPRPESPRVWSCFGPSSAGY